ncbi:MAG TPA: BON domain-containing protein, partial [Pyrinomonadaceae bacterium]
NAANTNFSNTNTSDTNLSNTDAANIDTASANTSNANLSNMNLSNANLSNVNRALAMTPTVTPTRTPTPTPTPDTTESDARLANLIRKSLGGYAGLANVSLTGVKGGRATLGGTVPSGRCKTLAERLTYSIKGVIGVNNGISVVPVVDLLDSETSPESDGCAPRR